MSNFSVSVHRFHVFFYRFVFVTMEKCPSKKHVSLNPFAHRRLPGDAARVEPALIVKMFPVCPSDDSSHVFLLTLDVMPPHFFKLV